MATDRTTRGGFGWIILGLALAVPGFLFYNWWSHLRSDREKMLASKARGRVSEGAVFQTSPNAKLINPMAVETSTAVAATPMAVTLSTGLAVIAETTNSTTTLALPATAANSSVGETARTAAAASPPISFSTAVIVFPKRDPMLSPSDRALMIEEEQAKLRAQQDLEDMKRAKLESRRPKKVREIDPRSLLDVQGIVSNPDSGFQAIVNNEVVKVGDLIGKNKIRVIKISDLGVTFDYMGKKFSKSVSKE